MDTREITVQQRSALAALERAERRLRRLTKRIYLMAALAAGATAILSLGLFLDLLGDGLTIWHVLLSIAITAMATQYPVIYYIEKIEDELSEQIAEISH